MIFRFGKYKGYTLADVELNDPSYVRWARNNAPNLIPKPSPPKDEFEYLDEATDFRSLKDLQHVLLRNPGKPEDAF
jgi:hypothetical protein|tara:strand:- start:60 stop:287 length:228 start_codon:yes stop_codon:yes gene_type:complete